MQAGPINPGNHRQFLADLFRSSVEAAMPRACLQGHWPALPRGKLRILAVGKAAMSMAEAASHHYGDDLKGLVLAPELYVSQISLPPGIEVVRSSHPVPDERSVEAAHAALDLAGSLGRDDLLLVLLSGGGSSVMCLPRGGLELAEKQSITRQLHACGASIAEINTVRKQLSAIKGGRLAAATQADVITLAISDVPGDDPSLIASGPTVEDSTTPSDASSIIKTYGIQAGQQVHDLLSNDRRHRPAGKPQARREFQVVASGSTMLQAAEATLQARGFNVLNLGDQLDGDASRMAKQHASIAMKLAIRGGKHCIISGGESSVTLGDYSGSGGRNTEYLLALAVALNGANDIFALACDSDGIDGNGEHAGACITPGTLQRALDEGMSPADFLKRHDSAGFFSKTGELLVTGPLLTNVNDFRAILVDCT